MSSLFTAIDIAYMAHKGQLDKAGQPYILHPLRVMLAQSNDIARIVGILHDVVEDSSTSLDMLRNIFGDEVADAIESVTRRPGEKYSEFIHRAKAHPIGRMVKIADAEDNLSEARRASLPDSLRHRYEAALEILIRD